MGLGLETGFSLGEQTACRILSVLAHQTPRARLSLIKNEIFHIARPYSRIFALLYPNYCAASSDRRNCEIGSSNVV